MHDDLLSGVFIFIEDKEFACAVGSSPTRRFFSYLNKNTFPNSYVHFIAK
jgi:hypothetical protein